MDTSLKEQIQTAIETAKKQSPDIDTNELKKILNKIAVDGSTVKEAIDVDQNFVELMYTQCYNLYQAGKYDEALKHFKFLEFIDSRDTRFSLGIAKCYEGMSNWELGLLKYLEIIQLNPEQQYFWDLFLCTEKIKNKDLSIAILTMIYLTAKDDPDMEDLAFKAESILTKLTVDIGLIEKEEKAKE